MDTELLEYNRKRNFDKSFEPIGEKNQSAKELKYVIQHHIATRDHYDFRLEWNGALLSWAVPKGPSFNPSDKRLAVKVEDHPIDYRNFEGTIPKGEYGGGTVMLWDEGRWIPKTDVDNGLREGIIKFEIKGKRLKGHWALVRLQKKEGETQDNWLLFKEKDEYKQDGEGIDKFDTSIRTGRTMAEITEGEEKIFAKNPFDTTHVQLAKMVSKVPSGDNWLYEVKYDGYRILAYIEENTVRLISRNGHNYTDKFKEIADTLIAFANSRATVLDGEMVIVNNNGNSDFQALQNYLKRRNTESLTYAIFDILALDGEDLRNKTLIERKDILEELLKNAPKNLYYSPHIEGSGENSFAAACKAGMEGIVGKLADSKYSGTRNGDWIKIKCDNRQEFVIGGYTRTDKKSSGLSALLLGVYEENDFVYAGRAGTGFTERMSEELVKQFETLIIEKTPFVNPPKKKSNEAVVWLKPELAAEIKFAEWTKENQLRQASFKGLRTDKEVKNIVRERAEEKETVLPHKKNTENSMEANTNNIKDIKITNPDKVIFEEPKVVKGEIISYYESVAERMLPYIKNRILSIVRCPKGVNEVCFYKKHPGPGSKGVVTVPITNSEQKTENYFYIKDIYGLLAEAQMGTIEFHTWGSIVETLDKPDIMVFDLDPDEGMELEQVRLGVIDLKNTLDELSLKSYLKVSGGKGYHVVVPFKPSIPWDTFNAFARRIAEFMEKKWSDRYTSNVRKLKRQDKIFIDWIRNGRGATSVAPYSIRARKGAKISMPIAWDELNTIAPDGIDMKEALKRINKPDPWQGFFQNKQILN